MPKQKLSAGQAHLNDINKLEKHAKMRLLEYPTVSRRQARDRLGSGGNGSKRMGDYMCR